MSHSPPDRSLRCAICILATGDYHMGARVMFHTLRKHGGLGPSSGVDCYAIGAEGRVPTELAQNLSISTDYSHVPVSAANFPQVAKKFEALKLPYRRVILLDADMLCVGDCSYLWGPSIGGLPFYGCRDTASEVYYGSVMRRMGVDHRRNFNGGTMVSMMTYWRESRTEPAKLTTGAIKATSTTTFSWTGTRLAFYPQSIVRATTGICPLYRITPNV